MHAIIVAPWTPRKDASGIEKAVMRKFRCDVARRRQEYNGVHA
jgi:hypothetical protein